MKKILFILFLIPSFCAFSQWECRSNLSGYLKPVSENSNLNWATEFIGSGGYLSNSSIANGMVFIGLDYTKNNHQLYIEGGFKYWNKHDMDMSTNFSKSTLGLRELSYKYFSPTFDLNIGLHQIKLADHFLVNERAWGASISKNIRGFDLNLNVASVSKDFARNGIFCSNCYLYDIVPSRNLSLGNSLGDTNFAAFSFLKRTESVSKNSSNDKQNETEEFDEFNDFESVESEKLPFLKSYGGVIYSEFGSYYNKPQLYAGITGEFNLGKIATLKAEGLYQHVKDSKALILYLQAEKSTDWASGNISTLKITFLGKQNINDNALAMPRFSNLFMGEVMRMDAIDMPLINTSIKHQFIDKKLSLKLQYTRQLKSEKMQELDLSIGKYFFKKHLRSTLTTGVMNSSELDDWAKLAKMEMRFFF